MTYFQIFCLFIGTALPPGSLWGPGLTAAPHTIGYPYTIKSDCDHDLQAMQGALKDNACSCRPFHRTD